MCDKNDAETAADDDEHFCDKDKFKSCFARSVAVNWQYKLQTKSNSETNNLRNNEKCKENTKRAKEKDHEEKTEIENNLVQEIPIRWRKNTRSASLDESSYHYYSKDIITSRRRTSSTITSSLSTTTTAATTITNKQLSRNEIPVENIYNQNKIETLQWQLRETEKSREMYKALMKQVVLFLEKAHTNLELLSSRMNKKISPSKSLNDFVDNNGLKDGMCEEYTSTWTSSKKRNIPNQAEIQPDKLSEEAFRLLRTAKSLLNTQEPILSYHPITNQDTTSEKLPPQSATVATSCDVEFLAQLAKEFPVNEATKSNLSFSPKLILPPESGVRISTAFNRKLSLQLNEVREKRNCAEKRASIVESDSSPSSPMPDSISSGVSGEALTIKEGIIVADEKKKEREKICGGSISSVEDESGFSSLTSFQDVGLPLVNSTTNEEISPRQALLNSMLYFEPSTNSSTLEHQDSQTTIPPSHPNAHLNDLKVWQTRQPPTVLSNKDANTHSEVHCHKRWNSMPDPKIKTRSLKVLWV